MLYRIVSSAFMDALKELLDGDTFIKRVTGQENSARLYA